MNWRQEEKVLAAFSGLPAKQLPAALAKLREIVAKLKPPERRPPALPKVTTAHRKLSAEKRYRLALQILRSEPGLRRYGDKRTHGWRLKVEPDLSPKAVKAISKIANTSATPKAKPSPWLYTADWHRFTFTDNKETK